MIFFKNVSKQFGSFYALKDVSFEIKKGEIVGFLGQNGAGKTTLMRLISSYLPASSGRIEIDGEDMNRQFISIRRKIGYLPENPPLYTSMRVSDYLLFAARLRDVPAHQEKFQVDQVLDQCDLRSVKSKTIAQLSKGFKQRVGIAQAIIHDPKILILDEPTNGLDPVQILSVRKLIKNLQQERIVILSTHILSEIEQIAQRVLILKNGRIIADQTIENLTQGARLEDVFLKMVLDHHA